MQRKQFISFLQRLGLKLWHKVTLRHFRESVYVSLYWDLGKPKWLPKPRKNTCLAICNCGWHSWMFKKGRIQGFFRYLRTCFLREHQWGEWTPVQTGGVYWDDDVKEYKSEIDDFPEETTIGHMRQCSKCYKVENNYAHCGSATT